MRCAGLLPVAVSYLWVIRDPEHEPMRTSPIFDSQEAAEGWLKDNWESLVGEGARSVVLQAGGRVVYEMGLEPA